jgi:hypothetical protein
VRSARYTLASHGELVASPSPTHTPNPVREGWQLGYCFRPAAGSLVLRRPPEMNALAVAMGTNGRNGRCWQPLLINAPFPIMMLPPRATRLQQPTRPMVCTIQPCFPGLCQCIQRPHQQRCWAPRLSTPSTDTDTGHDGIMIILAPILAHILPLLATRTAAQGPAALALIIYTTPHL